MKVLIACECSGTVRNAFRANGHEAWSCDMKQAEDMSPFHIVGDALKVMGDGWDLMIAHPPFTHLTVSGARWMDGKRNKNQHTFFPLDYVQDGMDFFMQFVNADIPRIAIESPIGLMSKAYRLPDQIINPWQFGESYQKATCLWLKGLPKLTPTKIVSKGEMVTFSSGRRMAKWLNDAKVSNKSKTSEVRSRTFQGIADAMADQWG